MDPFRGSPSVGQTLAAQHNVDGCDFHVPIYMQLFVAYLYMSSHSLLE